MAVRSLPAGKYTLWTLPHADNWEVFFNKKMYNWGVAWTASPAATREDVMAVIGAVEALPEELSSSPSAWGRKVPTLVFTWDKTRSRFRCNRRRYAIFAGNNTAYKPPPTIINCNWSQDLLSTSFSGLGFHSRARVRRNWHGQVRPGRQRGSACLMHGG
ncbi:MAG: DUF2911 domain-containing protein [Flavobacteriales bacterium]|nr:DUF2911 domain-containing protein [Flavobacteriales bacterium]